MTPTSILGYAAIAPVNPNTDRGNRELARAQANLVICKRLTDALYDYLTEAAQSMIEEITYEKTQAVDTFTPSMENLDQACKRRDYIQQQLDATRDQADRLEQSLQDSGMNHMTGYVGMLRTTMIMPLEVQLKDAEEWVSNIQRQMEAAAHAAQTPTE